MTDRSRLEDDGWCVVCGMENPDGFRLDWKVEGHVATAECVVPRKFQGYKGVVHGGILATLLDEAMFRLVAVVYGEAVGAKIAVRYHRPARVDEPIRFRGEIVETRHRVVTTRAEARLADGTLIASAEGTAMVMPDARKFQARVSR